MKKYTELWTIPIAMLLYWIYTSVAEAQGWHVYGAGIFQKLFLGTIFFLALIGIARVIFLLTFPFLYRHIDQDFKENDRWEHLTPSQRTWAGLVLLCVYFLVFALLMGNL